VTVLCSIVAVKERQRTKEGETDEGSTCFKGLRVIQNNGTGNGRCGEKKVAGKAAAGEGATVVSVFGAKKAYW
jgi:hypothetical protein